MNALPVLIPAIGGAIAIAVGLFLIRAARYARRPAKGERGLTPLYCEQAGGRFDTWNWTIPFVRVATFEDFISISCITHHIVLNKGEVKAIERERHLFSIGLRLHHHRPELPDILLWPRNRARLEAALRASLAV
jgi:hypothetical protein